jgi:hypothetical protein
MRNTQQDFVWGSGEPVASGSVNSFPLGRNCPSEKRCADDCVARSNESQQEIECCSESGTRCKGLDAALLFRNVEHHHQTTAPLRRCCRALCGTTRSFARGKSLPDVCHQSRHGPPWSVTVAFKTMTGEMQHDEHQYQHTDDSERYLDSSGSLVVRLLLSFMPLLLLASPVAGQAPRFVHP